MGRKPVTIILAMAGGLIAAGVLYWRVGRSDFQWHRFWTTFTQLHSGWLILGIALVFLPMSGELSAGR